MSGRAREAAASTATTARRPFIKRSVSQETELQQVNGRAEVQVREQGDREDQQDYG